MVKALLYVIFGIVCIAIGVYFLMSREKLNDINKQLKQSQKEISDLTYVFEEVEEKLSSIEKPLDLLNRYSSKVVYFMKKR